MDIENLAVHAQSATDLLKQLSNDKRLMICCCLGIEELSVSQLNKKVPLSQSALSQHLAKMRSANIVTTRRDSQVTYTKSIKFFPTQRELKGLEARHGLKRMVIPLSKSITPPISLLNSPLGACQESDNFTNLFEIE